MTEKEFLEYTSDPNNANRIHGSIDIAEWNLGFDKVLEECKRCNPKDGEAIQYILDNKINSNFLMYRHLNEIH